MVQFERVCSLLLSGDAGLKDVRWTGHADTERVTVVDGPVTVAAAGLRLERPVTVRGHPLPTSNDPVSSHSTGFDRDDVARVLSDL